MAYCAPLLLYCPFKEVGSLRIGSVEIASRLALAPMAGVTDSAFRQICSELGAGLTYTELVSAKALCYQDKKSRELLRLFPGENPCCAQIFGSDIACMAEAAQIAAQVSGASFIDINMGCPVGKVVASGDGSALMKDPEKAARLAEAVVKASPVPVTVKMRRGWDKGSINAVPLSKMLEEVGVAAIAVHGRTRVQMYAGQADWTTIREVELAAERRGERIALLDARRHCAWYLKGVPHAACYKEQIVHMETLDDLYRVTRGIKRDLHD